MLYMFYPDVGENMRLSPSSFCATDTLMTPHKRFGDVLYFSSSAFYFYFLTQKNPDVKLNM